MSALYHSTFKQAKLFTYCLHKSLAVRCLSSVKPADDHYKVLGLPQNCTRREIKSSFFKLSKKYHPDVQQNKAATNDEFIRICQAYEVLYDRSKRSKYDEKMLVKSHPHISKDDPMLKYYRDGTFYTGERDWDKVKRRFNNGQVVMIILCYAFIGALIQLGVIIFFANRRKIWSDGVHNDSVEIWEKVRAKAKTGDTQLQKDLAEYKKRKQAKQTEDELLVDVAPTS